MWSSSNGSTIAEVEITGIDGEKGLGVSRLFLNVRFSVYPQSGQAGGKRVTIRDLSGEIHVKGRAPDSLHLGRLLPKNGPVIIEIPLAHQSNAWHSLEVDLDRRQLDAIEDLRQGGGLLFTVPVYGVVDLPSGVEILRESLTYLVIQGVWIETLAKLGYSRIMLLEIPIPDSNGLPEVATSVTHLSNAQQAMARGDYREAVGLCRDSIDALSLALGDQDDQDAVLKPLFAGSRQMDKATRLRVLRRAAQLFTHPARHADEVSAQIEWNRLDAQTIVSIVAALLQEASGRKLTPPG